MKKIILSLILVVMATAAFAQTPDKIYVGPYEINYYDKGDYEYMLRDNVDLYDYYKLQKDTTIVIEEKTEPVKHGMQAGLNMRLPFGSVRTPVVGAEGVWKQGLGKNFYLNAGLGLNYVPAARGIKAGVEVGIPVSVEYTKLDRKKTSVYVGAGIVPAFYTGAGKFDVAPRVDFGGYIPFFKFNQLFRIGVFGQFNTNVEVRNQFTKRGLSVGGTVGFVF